MSNAAEQWVLREKQILQAFDEAEKWACRHARWNRIAHRVTSIIVLICAVLAPVLVVSSGQGSNRQESRFNDQAFKDQTPKDQTPKDQTGIGKTLAVFDVDPLYLSQLAVALTLILGLTEGVRRLFHFEQRWAAGYRLRQGLHDAREGYLDSQIGKDVGSDGWITNYKELRNKSVELENADTGRFFESVLGSRGDAPASSRGL